MADRNDVEPSKHGDTPPKAQMGKWIGIGAGIGSAAIAAALLYTNGSRTKPPGK